MMTAFLKFPLKRKIKLNFQSAILLLLLFCYVIGFCVFSVLYLSGGDSFKTFSKWLSDGLMTARNNVQFGSYLFFSIIKMLPLFVCIYFLGVCPFGCVFVPIIILFKGAINSLALSYLYQLEGIGGLGFNALVTAPYFIFYTFIILLVGREAFCLSTVFLKNIMPSCAGVNMYSSFKTYTIRFLFILCLILICAVIDTVCATAFYNFF